LRYALTFLLLCIAAAIAGPEGRAAQLPGAAPLTADPAAATGEVADAPATRRNILRVLTDADYPPFNYFDELGQLTGFNVDFARSVCVELEVSCDIKTIAWDDLLPTLERGDGDAVIASIAATPGTVTQADFSLPYYFMTGRFAVRKDGTPPEISPVGLEGRKISVAAGTAHEAYLKAFFLDSQIVSAPTAEGARQALAKGQADVLFGDSLALAFWTNGTSSNGCCEISGPPYADERYFGGGVSVAVRRGDVLLRRQLDAAIIRIRSSPRYEELLSRYFPIRLF
jgi:polar amino acid transport system substrate-binding protein